jgi:type I restriction enzyme, S subunit
MSETLGDYFELIRGTTYKSALLNLPGPVLLGLASIERNGGFRSSNLKTYGGDSPTKLLVRPGELYLSLKDVTQSADLLGAVSRLPVGHPIGRLTQDTVRLVPRRSGANLSYLYWLLRTPQYRAYCRAHSTGTTNLGLAREDFLAFPVPELSNTRAKQVKILEALEDKIELNRRMSATLEEMARAIFKSWFIAFDPVHAKSEGRPTGLPPEIDALFPNSFQDSELGPIPRGWEATRLDQVVDINPSRTIRKGSTAKYLDMANVRTEGHTVGKVIERDFGSGTKFRNGDTLLARITPCLENGKTSYVDFLEEDEIGWGSTEFVVLHPKAPLPGEYGYCLARSQEFREYAIQSMTGSSGRQRVQPDSLANYLVVRFPDAVAIEFRGQVHSIFERISAAETESKIMAQIRDALLPKLINGDLKVS